MNILGESHKVSFGDSGFRCRKSQRSLDIVLVILLALGLSIATMAKAPSEIIVKVFPVNCVDRPDYLPEDSDGSHTKSYRANEAVKSVG